MILPLRAQSCPTCHSLGVPREDCRDVWHAIEVTEHIDRGWGNSHMTPWPIAQVRNDWCLAADHHEWLHMMLDRCKKDRADSSVAYAELMHRVEEARHAFAYVRTVTITADLLEGFGDWVDRDQIVAIFEALSRPTETSTYAHDAHCNTTHTPGPQPCPPAKPPSFNPPSTGGETP